MAYTPTVWQENDLASSERMNKIEHGIAQAYTMADEQYQALQEHITEAKGELQSDISQVQTQVTQVGGKVLPTGGTTGQMLTKASDNDFDAEWTDVPESITMDDVNAAIEEAVQNSIVESFNGRSGEVVPQSGDYTADMVGARPNTWTPTTEDINAVPISRTVNGKPLSSNITLTSADVNARPDTWTPTAEDVGAVPTSRTVNGKALSSNITLTASDVGAIANTPISTISVLTENEYDALTTKSSTTLYLVKEEA